MNKFLCIVIGANHLQPMIICADIYWIVQRLSEESKNNTYLYCLYTYNDKLDVYMPYGVVHNGLFSDKEGYRIRGLRIDR